MSQTPHDQALSKAKIALMSSPDSAFFTYLAFSLKHIFNPNIPTGRTNGLTIEYNPDFFMSLDPDERVSMMLHESMHCAYMHMERGKAYDHTRYNKSADHVINLQLKERGFKIPDTWLCDDQYKGMSADEIYYVLPVDPPGGGGGNWGIGSDLDDYDGDPQDLQEQIQDIVVQAAMQSKMSNDKPGTIPGDVEIFLNKLLKPKLPWHRILAKYMQALVKNDYSYRKPNRRFFPQFYLPSMYSEEMISFALAVDTSGSVTDEEFHQFVSETHSIMKMMKPEKITVIQFDTEIKSVDEVKDIRDLMNIRFSGRGGTDVAPVIHWANENKPQLLLVFSDGEFYPPGVETKSHTLWVIHNDPQWVAPFGKVIHYEME